MPRDATQSYQGRLVLLLAIYNRHFCAPAVECGRDRLLLMRLGLRVVLAGSGARMQTAGAVELPAACTPGFPAFFSSRSLALLSEQC